MLKKIFLKLTHFILGSILFFFIILLLLNIFSAQILNFYISKTFDDKVVIHIGKVKRVFLPIYLDVGDVYFETKKGSLFFKEGSCELNLRAFFSKKPFVNLSFKDIVYVIKENKRGKTNIKFLFDAPFPFYIIRSLSFEDLIVKKESEDSIVIEKLNVQNKDRFQIILRNFSVFEKKLKINDINFELNGKLFKRKLLIQNANVQGIDIDGKFSGYLGKKGYEARFQFTFGTAFLKLFDSKLTGNTKITGKITDGKINAEVVTEKLYYGNDPVLIKGNFEGTLNDLHYAIKKFQYRNIDIAAFGRTDLKSLEGKVLFNKPLVIHQDKERSFTIKNGSYDFHFFKKIGTADFVIIGAEDYRTHLEFRTTGSDIFMENIFINSSSAKLKGHGSYKGKSLKLFFNGVVKNNKELIKLLNFSHHINISFELKLNNEGFVAKGVFKGLSPTKYHNLKISNYNGDFKFDKGILDFKVIGFIQRGKVSVVGQIKKKFNEYKVKVDRLPFNEVLGYFGVKSWINFPVSGETAIKVVDSKVFVKGKVNKVKDIDSLKINFSYESNRLHIDNLVYKNKKYKNPGYIDFKHNKVNFSIRDKDFKYKYEAFQIAGLSIKVKGNLLDPKVLASGNVIHTKLGKFEALLSGNLNNLKLKFYDEGVKGDFNITDLQMLNGVIAINNYNIEKDVKISSFIYLKSEDLKNFNFSSTKSLIYYGNYMVELNDLRGNYKDGILILKGGNLSGDYFKNLKIKEGFFSSKNFNLKLVPERINFENFVVLQSEGELLITGDYENFEIFADVYGKGVINVPELYLNVDVISFNLNINRKRISAYLIGKKLDTYIRVSIFSENLYQLSQYKMILTGKNIFVSKDGFSGVLNVNITKNRGENEIKGDFFITKGIFNYKKMKTISTSSEKLDFPFDFDIHIYSVKPVKLIDDFVDGKAFVRLNVVYKKGKLDVTGLIKSVESYLRIANEKFFVEEGYLKIEGDRPPYIYTKAVGTGSFSYLTIKIYGFLPDYTVEIEDLNPNSRENIFNKARTQSKNVISSFFTGSLLRELTGYTEKLLGINKIGLEETSVSGTKMKDYFKIGRKFSDRLEIKYLVDTEGKGEGFVIGEYLLFDWLKFNITYSNKEGSGAGITFFTDF
ncbi:hypothetical protein FHQ18_02520 [Deferribacter autotrophicus]|uniref:Translocation and assembly module TamB C-terminal domain-containing protein n=1 Tax=Deferribacter autotrophicus TaxID=500465 RepID=A0A5A8F580_9BACT|nr:translocation/assembly module TamB domain-containing protein [Deferribacter autotrophicus]KAA0258840.1 hypothetical protein FHQ18_02520 [Deferribacter autotrophicus]